MAGSSVCRACGTGVSGRTTAAAVRGRSRRTTGRARGRRGAPGLGSSACPRISSITAFAAASGISLNGGFIVSDGLEPDSRILLKVRRPKEKADELRTEGYREFVLVERMYFEDMKVYRNDDLPEKSDYLSVMYARR